jgi:hypothetical protein
MKKFCLQFILTFTLVNSALGQLIHNDPYKMDYFIEFNLEFTKQEILENKINSIACFEHKTTKKNKKKGKGILLYQVKFNSQGNPTKYSRVYTQNVWWLYKFNPTKKYHDFLFTYNSFEKLIKINNYVKSNKHSKVENEVCFFYHSLARVSKIYVSQQYIYKAGFKYRGVKYDNFSVSLRARPCCLS